MIACGSHDNTNRLALSCDYQYIAPHICVLTFADQETALYGIEMDMPIGIDVEHNDGFIDGVASGGKRDLPADALDGIGAFNL